MYIPMIFFTIIIERRKLTPAQIEAKYAQQQALKRMEEQRHQIVTQFPEFLIR